MLYCVSCGAKSEGQYGHWTSPDQKQEALDSLLQLLGLETKQQRGGKDSTCHVRRQAQLQLQMMMENDSVGGFNGDA